MRQFFLPIFCLGLVSCAQSQPQSIATSNVAAQSPLRALIVSGGPSPDYNQYAIESNARYVEKLTAGAVSQRILFADGSKTSRTISALENRPDAEERTVFSWIYETDDDSQRESLRAPTLKHIDGPATKKSVLQNVQKLASEVRSGERGLIYFTGHGSPGQKPRLTLFGPRTQDDFDNTLYALWNEEDLSTKELATAVQQWPEKVPLVLIMVQCHAGGFANLIFEGGDPKKPLWNRDFCGFFAATGDRQASGCTSEVDETDYQDFTTHFFAALSGISREGKKISGADYDHSGAVSLLEAFAWTNLQDDSIDVPVCTSEAYLRQIFPQNYAANWMQTPYSQLVAGAAPWQKALFEGLSQSLGLKGETRVAAALAAHEKVEARLNDGGEAQMPTAVKSLDVARRFTALKRDLKARFRGLAAPHSSNEFIKAKSAALRYLSTRPADVEVLARAARLWQQSAASDAAREAMLWRFVRAARTRVLEKRLAQEGTTAQKAAFARLRASENRNPL